MKLLEGLARHERELGRPGEAVVVEHALELLADVAGEIRVGRPRAA
jgi:hypothetical protein